MATIETTLALHDFMSSQLAVIRQNVVQTAVAMDGMGEALEKAGQSAALEKAAQGAQAAAQAAAQAQSAVQESVQASAQSQAALNGALAETRAKAEQAAAAQQAMEEATLQAALAQMELNSYMDDTAKGPMQITLDGFAKMQELQNQAAEAQRVVEEKTAAAAQAQAAMVDAAVAFALAQQDVREKAEATAQAQADMKEKTAKAAQAAEEFKKKTEAAKQQVEEAGDKQKKMNEAIEKAKTAMGGFVNKVKELGSSFLSFLGFDSLEKANDYYRDQEAILNRINDGLQENAQLQEMMGQGARDSRSEVGAFAGVVGSLYQKGVGFETNDDAIEFAKQLYNQFNLTGASTKTVQGYVDKLVGSMKDGVIKGDEALAVLKMAPELMAALADQAGMPMEKFEESVIKGHLKVSMLQDAVSAMGAATDARMQELGMSLSQVWNNMKISALEAFAPVMQKIQELANNPLVQEMAESLTGALAMGMGALVLVLEQVSNIFGFFQEHLSFLAPLVWGLVAAFAAYEAILLITKLATGAQALVSKILAGELLKTQIAQHGLNASLLWMVLGIIAIVAVFFAVVQAINHFTGESLSAFGIVGGALGFLGAFIANVFFGLMEIVKGVIEFFYNGFIAFANFFGNVLNDPVASIIHLFGDLADNVLGVIEKIASALDFVFGSNLKSTVQGWRSSLKDMVDWAAEEYGSGEYEQLYDELDLDSVMEEMGHAAERFTYEDAWSKGYQKGEEIGDKAGELLNRVKGFTSGGEYDGSGGSGDTEEEILESISKNGANTAANTARMADSMELRDEDITYIRDMAERKAVNEFTAATLAPNIQVSFGDVKESADANQILGILRETITEELNACAEGVYAYV